ncbi:DNA glycosylase [Dentipellis sp. KUC8613]|nr:DNA glycosylase [Dentipellis sp. KUC8613]
MKRSVSASPPPLTSHTSAYSSSVTLFTLPEPDADTEPSTIRRSKRIKLETPAETIKTEVQTTTVITKSSKAAKAKAPKSPRKPKAIPQALATPHPAPAKWKETYDAIREMRSKIVAPVDTMGCDRAQLKEDEPKNQRFATLVSLMLSSQTKDEVTDAAVSKLRTAIGGSLSVDALIAASEDTVAEAINKVGFWRRKTQYLKQAAQKLRDDFNSDVPKTVDELCSLPGVGPKMAFLALQVAWNINVGIGVDVHVHRITNRLGWHKPPTKNPEETRLNLQSWLPKKLHGEINHLLVGFGQVVCLPVGPKCDECTLSKSGLGLCPSAQSVSKSKSRTKKTVTTAPLSSGGPKLEISIEESMSTTVNVPPKIETASLPVSPLTAASDSDS